ncbi:MAG: hypothetical protein ACRDCW_14440 [Sarcina sp.]
MKKIMVHSSGIEKKIKVGFSWTTFFFGWIPSVCRGDFVSALKLFFIGIITLGVYPAVKCFSINKDYEKYLKSKGYEEGALLKEGFPTIKPLEYIATILEIIAPILIVIVYIIFSISMFSGMNNLEASAHGIKTESIFEYFNDEPEDQQVDSASVQKPQVNKTDTTTNSLEPLPKDSTYSSVPRATKDMYKTDIDTAKINEQLQDISKQISTIYINYGDEVKTNNGVPVVAQDNKDDLDTLKYYNRDISKVLNEQWGILKKVLTTEAFNKLQIEQMKWIKQKDIDAKNAEDASSNELGKDILYYSSLGSDTYYRIAYLNSKYLQKI